LIRQVILRAFAMLRQRSSSLCELQEDEITVALHAIIENDLRQNGGVNGFNRGTFETVLRQSQIANFDLTKLAKAPDLCFKLRNDEEEPRQVLPEHDGLFVECKPIDRHHAAGKYCDLGLIRFVNGDYAWAMQEGLMLGYARHGRTIAAHLLPAMQHAVRLDRLKIVEVPQPVRRSGAEAQEGAESLHVSRHRRDFFWVESKGRATEILIYHSWHNCD